MSSLDDRTPPPPPPPPPPPAPATVAPPRRRGAFWAGMAVGFVAGGVIAFSVTAWLGTTMSWSPGGLITYGAGQGPTALEAEIGDCLDVIPDERGTYSLADCSTNHDLELAAVIPIPLNQPAGYPGEDPLDFFSAGACEMAFADYIGRPWAESVFDFRAIIPDRGAWDSGNRDVYCFIRSMDDGGLHGSKRGTGR